MASIEKKALEEGFSGEDFMLKAAAGITDVIRAYAQAQSTAKKVTLFAGKGNNGGDAYCAALLLMKDGFEVEAYQVGSLDDCSDLCSKYAAAFQQCGGKIHKLDLPLEIELPEQGIILDGILGTGFKGAPTEQLDDIFDLINTSTVPIFSIDIPSGLAGDTGLVEGSAICADYTIFLGLAKTGFFVSNGWDHIGKLIYVDFGLEMRYLKEAPADFEMITAQECAALLPPIRSSRNKYQAGFVAGFSGSKSMIGASILSGMGALKSGCGIVKIVHLGDEIQKSTHYPELIHQTFSHDQMDQVNEYINKANAIYVGPGLGLSDQTQNFIEQLLKSVDMPCIIDADALNIMALKSIAPPKNAILTPHQGEAKRLLKLENCTQKELMAACQEYVELHKIVLILKGGPTFIFSSGATAAVCSAGDPGMATAGSGDVLTGILAALLAQMGPELVDVAKLGVYLHGKAGELAAEKNTSYCMIATDLLKSLYKAWEYLLGSSVV
ncbi:MAG: Bifunctional NAD(P)H-hydrate repair enzyme Nnr [Chlamydiae bacterium]|nr:Bifunctional NAD(P)H-hydrate repair enzyme Nnr [Chlamydiota bacterium]